MAVVAGAILVGAAAGAYVAATAQQGGNESEDTPATPGPTTDASGDQTEPAPTLSGESPTGCGDWPATAADGPIAAEYGEIRNCGRHAGIWVVTTLGNLDENGLRRGGVIGLYDCKGDESCLDNGTDHPLAGWEFLTPPFSGGITITGALDDETLILIVGNALEAEKFTFNVVTRVFTVVTSPTQVPATPALR